jgi:hypothetical protein
MKKLYLSLFFATNVAFVSCMEKERQYYDYNLQQLTVPVFTLSTPYQPQIQQYSQPGYCEANEPGWEFYDDIANMSYNSHQHHAVQPSPMTAIPQTPVYKPANTTTIVTQRDVDRLLQDKGIRTTLDKTHREWCLHNNPLPTDKDIMEALHHQAYNIFQRYRYNTTRSTQKFENEQFAQIIKDMNSAKEKGINEDLMGEFAYNKSWDSCIPIIFMLLKKYNATVQATGEKLPSFYNSKKPSLTEILSTRAHTNINNVTPHITNTCNEITKYPAFFQLVYTLCDTVQEHPLPSSIKTFITYVYENNNILLEGYSDGSYKDFKSEFYTKAYDMLQAFLHESGVNCYNLVQMIDKAKEMGDINNEDDLIAHMARYTAPQSFMTQLKNTLNSSHIDTERKRIVLFCKLVKIYNNKRGFKMTPTLNQHHAYSVKKALDISLPESLKNRDLLDENSYAFVEIPSLINAIDLLKKASADEINNLL